MQLRALANYLSLNACRTRGEGEHEWEGARSSSAASRSILPRGGVGDSSNSGSTETAVEQFSPASPWPDDVPHTGPCRDGM